MTIVCKIYPEITLFHYNYSTHPVNMYLNLPISLLKMRGYYYIIDEGDFLK